MANNHSDLRVVVTGLGVVTPDVYKRQVLAKIHSGDESLSKLIPAPIFEIMKAKKLFGWAQETVLPLVAA